MHGGRARGVDGRAVERFLGGEARGPGAEQRLEPRRRLAVLALEESVLREQQGAARGGRRARRRVRDGRQQVPQRIGGRLGRGGRETWFMAVSVRLVPGFKRFTRTL